ncbi:MAG: hypothetical protein ABR521_08660 [Gaiellaceae bacterium]
MRNLPLVLCILALAIAAVPATAGAEGDGQPLPAAKFVRVADAACARYYRALSRLPKVTTLAGIARFYRQAHPIAVRFLRELRALVPPRPRAVTYARLLQAISASNALDQPTIKAAEQRDAKRLERLFERSAALDRTIRALTMKLGLKVCANPPRL